jgi:hypothetical protein
VIADPEEAARVTVEEYADPGSLNVEEQTLEAIDQNTLIVTDDTTANGIFTITQELIDESIATLALGGIEIAAEDLFDTSVIDEVYEENPELKELPV